MTFAAIPWLTISINLLMVVFVIVCLLLILLVLMQRPKQEGLGAAFGGGVTDQVFGARTTNVLQRGTVYLGSLFFVLSLTLAVLIGHQNKQKKLVTKETQPVEQKAGETIPAEEEAEPAPKSLSEELPSEEAATPVETPESTKPETTAPAEPASAEPEAATEPTEPAGLEIAPPAEETSPDKAPEP